VILQGEIRCLSLLGFKGLNYKKIVMGFLNARRRESCMTGTMDEGKHQLFQV